MAERIYVLPPVRVSAHERKLIQGHAESRNMTVSEWIRMRATNEAGENPYVPADYKPPESQGSQKWLCAVPGCDHVAGSMTAPCPFHGKRGRK